MSGDFGLIKSNDAAATDAERCGTVFLSRSDKRFGVDLWFIPFAQIEQQYAMGTFGPNRGCGAHGRSRITGMDIAKKWLINMFLKNAGERIR
jgi:hypothetical protein